MEFCPTTTRDHGYLATIDISGHLAVYSFSYIPGTENAKGSIKSVVVFRGYADQAEGPFTVNWNKIRFGMDNILAFSSRSRVFLIFLSEAEAAERYGEPDASINMLVHGQGCTQLTPRPHVLIKSVSVSERNDGRVYTAVAYLDGEIRIYTTTDDNITSSSDHLNARECICKATLIHLGVDTVFFFSPDILVTAGNGNRYVRDRGVSER